MQHSDARTCTGSRSTRLGRLLRRYAPEGASRSGFSLISSGIDAFMTLCGMAVSAEQTLDVQYYLWEDDRCGRLLFGTLLHAADRGVRVRVLLDDIGAPRSDGDLAKLDTHPNIEIRLFNPFPTRLRTLLDLFFKTARLTRRMHNKAFVADSKVAVVGGRNVGDRYFCADPNSNYRDLDLFAAGPVVRDVARTFDEFWNSQWSRPIRSLGDHSWSVADLRTLVRELKEKDPTERTPYEEGNLWLRSFRALVRNRLSRLVWADDAVVVVDEPNKPMTETPKLLQEVRERLGEGPKQELLLEAAYFIPGRRGSRVLRRFARKGVAVRILTNSLLSSEYFAPYAGYQKFRRLLLRRGIELYEMRPKEPDGNGSARLGNLHTKAAVIDRRDVFVGSFNMDPRSVKLNTEIGLLIRSPELATQVAEFIEDGMAPSNAFRVMLNGRRLLWLVAEGGRVVPSHREPGKTLRSALVSWVMARLPIQGQL